MEWHDRLLIVGTLAMVWAEVVSLRADVALRGNKSLRAASVLLRVAGTVALALVAAWIIMENR